MNIIIGVKLLCQYSLGRINESSVISSASLLCQQCLKARFLNCIRSETSNKSEPQNYKKCQQQPNPVLSEITKAEIRHHLKTAENSKFLQGKNKKVNLFLYFRDIGREQDLFSVPDKVGNNVKHRHTLIIAVAAL